MNGGDVYMQDCDKSIKHKWSDSKSVVQRMINEIELNKIIKKTEEWVHKRKS